MRPKRSPREIAACIAAGCVLRRGEHVAHRDFGKSFHADAAGQAVSNFFAELVHAMERVKYCHHQRHRGQLRDCSALRNEIASSPRAAVDVQRDRNHFAAAGRRRP